MKRKPIRDQIYKMVLFISVIAVTLVCVIGIFFMKNIQSLSEDSLLTQMEQNIRTLVADKVKIADLELSKYKSYMARATKYIELIYRYPDDFVNKEVLPPDVSLVDTYSMQRYYANREIDKYVANEEMKRLGNLEAIWIAMMARDGKVISTAYVGTETGFLLSYDKNANFAELDTDGESYYDYFDSYWYTQAKNENRIVFTDLTQDSYGRGLTLTCAAPFYEGERFAGVIAMDILVTDLQQSIIDVDLGVGREGYAFIVDKEGDIVASPYVKLEQTEFENIRNDESIYKPIADKILRGFTDIDLIGDNVYCAYAPVTEANWKLCIRVPQSLIIAPAKAIEKNIRNIIIIFIISFFAISIIVAIITGKFSSKITTPLLSLKKDVEEMSSGNLDKQAVVYANDEISDLAHAFNSMTASLKKYISDLTSVTAEKERIGAELNVATQIQLSMLPSTFPAFPNDKRFDIHASMTPAKEVGGDFYDFFMIDDKHLAMVVADVSGKGVPAALFMVIGKTLIKDHSVDKKDLGSVFEKVNNLLCESNSEGLFITAFEAVIDLETGHVTYVNAGHEMPFIYRRGKDFNAFEMKAAFVLAGMEGMKYKAGEFSLEHGDKIFQYTDGVTEATNVQNELYGMERLKNILDANVDKKPEEILKAVKADIDKFVGEAPQFDDITMLGFEYK